MNNPLISVIIPVYNVEKYLHRCLGSVIAQTYQNLEIICVDDGSTDCSGEICEQYALKDHRVKVFHQENQGVSAARNKGLDIATGEYIAFIDSDDYIQNDMFEQLYRELLKSGASYVICGYNVVDPNGVILDIHSVDKKTECSGERGLRQHYYHSNGKENFVTVWGKLFSKKIFENLRFKEKICYEDIHLMPYLMLQAKSVLLIPYVGYNYVQNCNSIMNKRDERHRATLYKNAFDIWIDHLELYRRNGLTDLETAVYCACVDKVIAHSLSDSVPDEMKQESIHKAHRCTQKLIWRRFPSFKRKIYYGLFCMLGPNKFKALINARNSSTVKQ